MILSGLSPMAGAQSASTVSYTISPAAHSVQPNSTVDILVTLRTTVNLAGASVHLAFASGSFVDFESAQSPGLSFVDYHENFDDLVFICNNNNCAPGTYPIATITARVGPSGTTQVSFTPKETADTQLNLIPATGATGTYNVSTAAPPSPKPKAPGQRIVTVPQDDGEGGIVPLQITNDQFINKSQQAKEINEQLGNEPGSGTFWTPGNLVLIGLAMGAGFALFLFVLIKFFGRGSGPSGPYGSGDSGSPGPTAFVG